MIHRRRPSEGLQAARALLLAPSTGCGGGIERYASGVEAAFERCGIPYVRLDLRVAGGPPPSLFRKLIFARSVLSALRDSPASTRLVLAHPGLLPLAIAARHVPSYAGTTVHYYGSEVWRGRRVPGARLTHRDDIRAVTLSSFTSGVLQRSIMANVVVPPLSSSWFTTLVAAREAQTAASTLAGPNQPLRLLTVFRLSDWRDKGLPTIMAAAATLDRPVALTIVGSGDTPQELRDVVRSSPGVRLKANLSDVELAAEYARSDVCVGATRTRTGRAATGEGFGLTLVEAQLAGTAVIAPAYGGSHDTFQAGVTGIAPPDESVGALSRCLQDLANEPVRLAAMSAAAHEWSRVAFDPERSARSLMSAIL